MSAHRAWALWFSRVRLCVCVIAACCVSTAPARAQQEPVQGTDWQTVRQQAQKGKLDAVLETIEARLVIYPNDLEAHGWRGRVLAWKGRWLDAESEYRLVLRQVPHDVEMLTALADVLLWQEKPQAALEIIDDARGRAPATPEVLLTRARILRALARTNDVREQLREVLRLDPANKEAKSWLASLRPEYRHELRFGNDVDTFNYTDAAQTQSAVLNSRWNRRWSTVLGSQIYERFGKEAQKFSGSTILRISNRDWFGIGSAGANDSGIVPRVEASVEFGHGFHFENHVIRGMETSYQQRWLWYRGAHVLTLSGVQTYYLPRDLFWVFSVTGARSGFTGTGVEWASSGGTRLRIPLHQQLSGHLSFSVGTESYGEVDQIGRFSARTFAGGLQFRFASNQDLAGYVARQNRSQDRSQTSYGLSYGIHF